MLDLNAFDNRTLYNVLSIIEMCKKGNIVNVDMVANEIHNHIEKGKKETRRNTIKECPSCGAKMSCGQVVDGLKINGCKKCRFSEVV